MHHRLFQQTLNKTVPDKTVAVSKFDRAIRAKVKRYYLRPTLKGAAIMAIRSNRFVITFNFWPSPVGIYMEGVLPPSIRILVPVIYPADGEARNAARAAVS